MLKSGDVVCIVGANRGLGFELARRIIPLCCDGINLVLGCRSIANAEEARKKLMEMKVFPSTPGLETKNGKVNIIAEEIDVCDENSVKNFSAAIKRIGPIAMLYLVAGVVCVPGYNGVLDKPIVTKIISTNFWGVVLCRRYLYEQMRPGGRVVVFGSSVAVPYEHEIQRQVLNAFDDSESIRDICSMAEAYIEDGAGIYPPKEDRHPNTVYVMSKYFLLRLVHLDAKLHPCSGSGRHVTGGASVDDNVSLSANVLITIICPGYCRTNRGTENAPLSAEEGTDTAVFVGFADEKDFSKYHGKFWLERKKIWG